MRCINCDTPDLSPDLSNCPHCGAFFEALYRDFLPLSTKLNIHDGKYTITDFLGRGGFGITYQAYSEKFASPVAIKEYFPQSHASRKITGDLTHISDEDKQPYDRWRARFLQEGRILFRLNHPSIVRVIGFFEERNTIYLVMQLLEGQTLDAELAHYKKRGKGLPEKRIVQIMGDLASALALLHRQEPPIYHLDIKPSNVMILPNGQAVLVDFGSAKLEKITTSTIARSDDYAPIEVWFGEYSEKTDIFELGMMLHELLTGQLPPRALSRERGENKGWQPSLAEPWQFLVSAAIHVEPEDRPRNVAAWWKRYDRWHREKLKQEEECRRQEEAAKREAELRRQLQAEEEEKQRKKAVTVQKLKAELPSQKRKIEEVKRRKKRNPDDLLIAIQRFRFNIFSELSVPLGIWMTVGYFWQTVDVKYGFTFPIFFLALETIYKVNL